jgi:hypothetical protein
MIPGHPLRIVKNQLRCGACGRLLPGRAAGAQIDARYIGPVLAHVVVTGPRDGIIHECEPETAGEAA